MNIDIAGLAAKLEQHRAGKGIREAAKEIGVSPATLSRVENQKIPDLDTFGKICTWLGDDPAIYLGIKPAATRVQVHFKKGSAIEQDSAIALGKMIELAHKALVDEESL